MKKMKIVLIVLIALITIACLGFLGYWAWNYHQRASLLERAATEMEQGNLRKAEEILIHLTTLDPAHEKAFRMLAKTEETKKQYFNAAFYWQKVASLNPLDSSLRLKITRNLLAAGEYNAVIQLLRIPFQTNALDKEELFDYLEASAFTGDSRQVEKILLELKKRKIDSPQVQLATAIELLKNKKYAESQKIFHRYTEEKYPKEIRWYAYFGLARLEALRGDAENALKNYRKAYQILPERTAWTLALFYQDQTQFQKAADLYEEELRLNPHHKEPLIRLGEMYLALNKNQEILDIRKRIKPRSKTDLEMIYYLEALYEFGTGHHDKLEEKLNFCRILADRPLYRLMKFTADAGNRKIGSLANDIRMLSELSLTKEQKQRIADTLLPLLEESIRNKNQENAEILADILKDYLPPESKQMLPVHMTLMTTSFMKEDLVQAKHSAAAILESDPNNQAALKIMAEALLATHEAEKSISYFKKLPKTTVNLLNLATALKNVNRNKEAETLLSEIYQKNPNDLTVLNILIETLLNSKKYIQAEQILKNLASSPENDYTKYYFSAVIAEQQNRAKDARIYYLRAVDVLKKMKQTPQIIYQTAYLYALVDLNEDAARLYAELLKQNPDWPLVLVNLSEVQAALGNDQEAMRLAKLAQKRYPAWNAALECLKRREAEWEKKYPPAPKKITAKQKKGRK